MVDTQEKRQKTKQKTQYIGIGIQKDKKCTELDFYAYIVDI